MPDTKDAVTNARSYSTAHYVLQEVEYLFCNFGTDHAPLIEEIAKWEHLGLRTPKVVICPHENVAVNMAGGYARATDGVSGDHIVSGSRLELEASPCGNTIEI